MQSSHRRLIAAGVALFLLGLGLYVGLGSETEKPPTVIARTPEAKTRESVPSPQVEFLSEPWFRDPPTRPKPAAAPAAAPTPPAPIDRTSVTFLGSFKDQNGNQAYFFKYSPTGQVMILRPGESVRGWTLKAIGEKSFSLAGNGGLYEVAR